VLQVTADLFEPQKTRFVCRSIPQSVFLSHAHPRTITATHRHYLVPPGHPFSRRHYNGSRAPMCRRRPPKRSSWVTVCYPVYNRHWSHIHIPAVLRVLVHTLHTHVHMNIQLILMYYTLVIHPGSGVVYLIAGHHTDPAPMDRKSSFSTPEIQNEIHCFFFFMSLICV